MEPVLVIMALTLYFMPALLAFGRSVKRSGMIFMTNLFLGWSLIGWVLCLIWSFSHDVNKKEKTS